MTVTVAALKRALIETRDSGDVPTRQLCLALGRLAANATALTILAERLSVRPDPMERLPEWTQTGHDEFTHRDVMERYSK